MNMNRKLAPIMLTKLPPVQMTECNAWSASAGAAADAAHHPGAHAVRKGDESAGKFLNVVLWNTLGTKAAKNPEKPSHLHGPYKCPRSQDFHGQLSPFLSNGGRGIRTPERVTPLAVFKTAAFNHSAIPPATTLTDCCCVSQRYMHRDARSTARFISPES
jgi:hypothetical protein